MMFMKDNVWQELVFQVTEYKMTQKTELVKNKKCNKFAELYKKLCAAFLSHFV